MSEPELYRRAVQLFRGAEGDERFLSFPGALSFMAVEGGDIAGWAWGQHMLRPDHASMLYLHELEVAESHRRRGIGRALLVAFMDAGRELGATKLFLTTGESNSGARALYEQLGGGLAAQGPTVSYWLPLGQ